MNVVNAIWLPQISTFFEKSGRPWSTASQLLTFGSHYLANFQPILDCFITKFKLEYDDLENIKTDCVNTVVCNVHQINPLKFLWGTPGRRISQITYQPKRVGKMLDLETFALCISLNLSQMCATFFKDLVTAYRLYLVKKICFATVIRFKLILLRSPCC